MNHKIVVSLFLCVLISCNLSAMQSLATGARFLYTWWQTRSQEQVRQDVAAVTAGTQEQSKLQKECKYPEVAVLCEALHKRCGAHSPAKCLSQHLLGEIAAYTFFHEIKIGTSNFSFSHGFGLIIDVFDAKDDSLMSTLVLTARQPLQKLVVPITPLKILAYRAFQKVTDNKWEKAGLVRQYNCITVPEIAAATPYFSVW